MKTYASFFEWHDKGQKELGLWRSSSLRLIASITPPSLAQRVFSRSTRLHLP